MSHDQKAWDAERWEMARDPIGERMPRSAAPPSAVTSAASKLRLEDAEAIARGFDQTYDRGAAAYLRALIDLYRAAKREVRCTCGGTLGSVLHDYDCACTRCPDTAAELERWE